MRTLEFIQRTAHRGITFDVLVLSGQDGELDQDFLRAGKGRIHYLRLGRSFWPRYYALLKREGYDVVHSHVQLVSGLLVAMAGIAGVKNRIAHIRSTDTWKKSSLRLLRDRFLTRVMLANATSIPCVSASVAHAVFGPEWEKTGNVEVVYNGFDLLDNPSTSWNAPLRIGHIGRFHESKNQAFLAEVYAELLGVRDDVVCTMTGKRDTENYQKVQSILSKEIAEGRVVLEPQTDHVSEVISACDLMVSTSTYEGLPGAIIESLSGGVPVVASAIMPSKEVAQQNEHVTIVDGWDARHWAKVIDGKLNELLLTPKLQSVRAVRKSIAEGPFHFEISDRLMLQLYSAHRADGFRAYEQLPEQTFA